MLNPQHPKRSRRRTAGRSAPIGLAALAVVSLLVLLLVHLLPGKQPAEATAAEQTLPSPAANPYAESDFYSDGTFTRCSAVSGFVGVDVSSHQKEIDWQKVAAAGVDFAMIRVGYRGYDQGGLHLDTMWGENAQGALDAGLSIGVYFYSQAITTEEARQEAELVLSAIRSYNITYPVVFDWECVGADARTYGTSSRTVTDCTAAFCQMIQDAGYTPCFYFNQSMARDTFRLRELLPYDFWLAQYSDAMTFAYDVDIWQYSNSGQVDGISTAVDLNFSFRDYAGKNK